MDQGEAHENDIQRWQQMIAGYKCAPDAPAPTLRISGIAIAHFGASRSGVSRIAIGAKRRLSWGLVWSLRTSRVRG
jgi:hypothetical protein